MPKRIEDYMLKEKMLPGTNFMLFIPIRFNGSFGKKLDIQFKEYCEKKNISKSDMCRKFFFNFFEVKNENELLKKYKDIRIAFQKYGKYAILRELNIEDSFSEWLRSEVKRELKKNEKNK